MSHLERWANRMNRASRVSIYADDWSDEEGDRALTISRDSERLYIAVYRQLGGRQEIHLPVGDTAAIIAALQRALTNPKA